MYRHSKQPKRKRIRTRLFSRHKTATKLNHKAGTSDIELAVNAIIEKRRNVKNLDLINSVNMTQALFYAKRIL